MVTYIPTTAMITVVPSVTIIIVQTGDTSYLVQSKSHCTQRKNIHALKQ